LTKNTKPETRYFDYFDYFPLIFPNFLVLKMKELFFFGRNIRRTSAHV